MNIYKKLQNELLKKAKNHNFLNDSITINCKTLTPQEAIGITTHNDYPINKGKEVMIEADFKGSKGQAFTDHFGNSKYTIKDLTELQLNNNRLRANFIASLNAVWRYLGKVQKTIHCKDKEPEECADHLNEYLDMNKKTLLIGLQPRFLEVLSKYNKVRVLDLDKDNIGNTKYGITIEDGHNFSAAVKWCEQIFATGSTLCNTSFENIYNSNKPVIFFGVTIAAAAEILNLNLYCYSGH